MTDLSTTVTVIDACGRAAVPVLLISDPGMGKSSLVRGLAAAEGVPCETVLGSIREPAGPDVLSGIAWCAPDVAAVRERLIEAEVEVSPVRPGRKPGTLVVTVRDPDLRVPTLLVGPA